MRRAAALVGGVAVLATAAANPAPGPLLGPGPPGSFDAARVAGPVVHRDATGAWRMWYTGSAPGGPGTHDGRTGAVGVARSRDGLAWERVAGRGSGGAILEPTVDPDRFDTGHIAVSDVAVTGDRVVLWYVGGRLDGRLRVTGRTRRGWPLSAVRAISTDGLSFQRDTGPSAGALLAPGIATLGNAASIGWPQVLAVGPRDYLLYFHAPGGDGRSMAYVGQSRDGARFALVGAGLEAGRPGDFDAGGIGARHVIRVPEGFLMAYEGDARGRSTGIGLARSADGRRFERVRGPLPGGAALLPAPGSGAWDGGQVGQPWLVPLPDGRYRLYYAGAARKRWWDRGPPAWRIGAAEAGPDLREWRRVGPDAQRP